jgi:hypothetical protein
LAPKMEKERDTWWLWYYMEFGIRSFCFWQHCHLEQNGIIDPDCRLIGLHSYDGKFKVWVSLNTSSL